MKITIIGAGNMGGAIVRGLLHSGVAQKEEILIIDPNLKEFEGVQIIREADTTISSSDIFIVAVKPWLANEVTASLRQFVAPSALFCSVVAGVSIYSIEEQINVGQPIARIMPNTAVSTGEGMTFYSVKNCSDEQIALLDKLLASTGSVMQVEERLLDAYMALCSCGIAFALRYIRAATQGGIELGIPAHIAPKVIAQTLRGAASLIENGAHVESEIDRVTTPGGVTIKGLNAMEQHGFSNSVIQGLKAAKP